MRKLGYPLVAALAVVLRGLYLSGRPLWYDEAFAVLFAEKGLGPMIYGTLASSSGAAADIHPLAYYTILWGWVNGLGSSPASVRFLSVLFGLGTVALSFFLAKNLFGQEAALPMVLWVAISPFQVHYAQEVRMYALLACLLTAATLFLWNGIQTSDWRWWVGFSLLAALAQYTHNLAGFYLLPLALTPFLLRRWRSAIAATLAGIGALLLYLPWLLRLPAQFAKIQQAYWTSRPSPARLVTALLSYVTNLPLPPTWLGPALFVTLLILALAAWQTFRSLRSRQAGAWAGAWLAYLAFTPLALLFLFSQLQPVFIERALLPSGVAFLLWLGWSIQSTYMPRIVAITASFLLAAAMIAGLFQHYTYRGFPYAPYAQLDASLRQRMQAGDVILHSNKLTLLPGVYYDRSLEQRYLADPPGSGSDTLALPTQRVLGLIEDANPQEAVGQASSVWFILFGREVDEYRALGLSEHPHLAWLEKNFHRQAVETWGEVSLYVFTR